MYKLRHLLKKNLRINYAIQIGGGEQNHIAVCSGINTTSNFHLHIRIGTPSYSLHYSFQSQSLIILFSSTRIYINSFETQPLCPTQSEHYN